MAQSDAALSTVKTDHPIATEPAVGLEDVYDGICNLVSQMKTISSRQIEAEHMSKINEFFVCEPPSFGDDTDPLVAKQWILRLENIFDCIGCSDKQKVSFAGLRLKDAAACSWWSVSHDHLKADGVTVTWEKFKELFNNRYFPLWLKYEKYRELCDLEQGDRTVAEYDAEFIKLSCFVSRCNPDEDWEGYLFDRGLKPEIKIKLCFIDNTPYPKIRDLALRLERCLNAQED